MRQITVPIGEHRFMLESLPGHDAMLVHSRLLRHAVPAIMALVEATDGKSLRAGQLGASAQQLLAALPEANFLELQDALLKRAWVLDASGGRLALSDRKVFDNVFCENVESVYLLMWEAVKLNFSRFLDRFRPAFEKLSASLVSQTQSLSTSPPTSGSSGSSTV